MAIIGITEAVANGSRQKSAWEILGISNRTLQNWKIEGLIDRRTTAKKDPANKLSEEEQASILSISNNKEFRSQSPKQIVPKLADRGIYLASESSFYRVLRKANQLHHRGRINRVSIGDRPQ